MRPIKTRPASRPEGASTANSPSRSSLSRIMPLVQRYVLCLDHAGPPCAVGLDEFNNRGSATRTKWRKTNFLQRGAEHIVAQGTVEACTDFLRNFVGHLRRRRNAVPNADHLIRGAPLGHARDAV